MSALALTFRIFRGDQLLREETLRQGVIKIGKVASAHLRIDDDSVSRMHAILEVDTRGEVHVIDLGSTRGTFINGHKVNKAKLESGDAIQIGDLRIEVAFARTDEVLAKPVVVAAAPPPVPVAAKPVVPAYAFTAAPGEDDLTGAKAIEVAAMLGDSVVGVKHCMDPKSGKVSSKTYGLFAAGAACLVASAIAFGASVHTAAYNKGGLDYTTHVLKRPAYSYRPATLDPAFDWIAFGGLAFGVSSLIAGLARMRGEKRTPYFRIGTAPEVELALESAPSPSFPLVAPSADGEDFVFNYSAGIEGELTLDGNTMSLADLAASGRARPSLTTAGALELPIPSRAKIRARSGQTTFVVSAVPRPRQQPLSLVGALESRTMKYFAGSLAAHLALIIFLAQIPLEDSASAFEARSDELPAVAITGTEHETMPDKPDPAEGSATGDPGDESQKMALEPGAAGNPASTEQNKRMAVKNNGLDSPQIAREAAIEEARTAGILGSISSADSFHALAGMSDLSNGIDSVNAYGQMFGAEAGEAYGAFGMSVSGFGRGGGCTQEPCGLIGMGGRYNTISNGHHAGQGGWGPGGGIGGPMRHHEAGIPRPILGQATGTGDLDQATIRRYIKRNIEKISYCYEHELLAHPAMEGSVLVQFFITPTGTVTGSKGSGFDGKVASCVAEVVGNIEFPRPNGGGVQVNYPFTFHAAGH